MSTSTSAIFTPASLSPTKTSSGLVNNPSVYETSFSPKSLSLSDITFAAPLITGDPSAVIAVTIAFAASVINKTNPQIGFTSKFDVTVFVIILICGIWSSS